MSVNKSSSIPVPRTVKSRILFLCLGNQNARKDVATSTITRNSRGLVPSWLQVPKKPSTDLVVIEVIHCRCTSGGNCLLHIWADGRGIPNHKRYESTTLPLLWVTQSVFAGETQRQGLQCAATLLLVIIIYSVECAWNEKRHAGPLYWGRRRRTEQNSQCQGILLYVRLFLNATCNLWASQA